VGTKGDVAHHLVIGEFVFIRDHDGPVKGHQVSILLCLHDEQVLEGGLDVQQDVADPQAQPHVRGLVFSEPEIRFAARHRFHVRGYSPFAG
jgi:hypothetical protein